MCEYVREIDAADRIGTLNGGVGLYFLQPYAQDNQAFVRTSGFTTPDRVRFTEDFNWGVGTTPMVWLGWQSVGGFGVRVRYFNFDQRSGDKTLSLDPTQAADVQIRPSLNLPDMDIVNPISQGSPGVLLGQGLGVDNLRYTSSLVISTSDLEAMYDLRTGPYLFVFSGGIRYMYMSQRYEQTLSNTATVGANTATELSVLDFSHGFHGIGPTISVQGFRQLRFTGLSFFTSVRGSLLAGDASRELSFLEAVDDPGGIGGGSQSRSAAAESSQTGLLSVVELEVGMQFTCRVRCFTPFVRGALVDQTYFGAGSASRQEGDLSLLGGQLSFGANY